MSGWRATGNTRPDWHSCHHQHVINGACADCHAKAWPGFVQARQPGAGLGAIPLGSPYLVQPKLDDYSLMNGGPNGVTPRQWVGKAK